MDNSTIVKIYGSKRLFKSIAKELILEAEGKSHAQKMTEKMMKTSNKGGGKTTAATGETVTKEKVSNEGNKKTTTKVASFETDTEDVSVDPVHKKEAAAVIKKVAKMLADRWSMEDTDDVMKIIKAAIKKPSTEKKSEEEPKEEPEDEKETNKEKEEE